MFKIALVNMPFADIKAPSLALTQLSSVVRSRYGDRVSVKIAYPNQDLALLLGKKLYRFIEGMATEAGMGEWFFRQAAFPECPDNTDEYLRYFQRYYFNEEEFSQYFQRYGSSKADQIQCFQERLNSERQKMDTFLDYLIAKYRLDEIDLVGFTSMFGQNMASFALARAIKERNPHVTIVMGGANCEAPMGTEIIRNVKAIDFVFSGPSLKSFPEFVGYYLAQQPQKCHCIPGVFSKKNYLLQSAHPIGADLDINTVIALDYDDFLDTFERNFPNREVKPVLYFETSRGCWWGERSHCTFCGLNGLSMNYRAMAPEKALAQLHSLFERYASRCSLFQSVDNILPKSYIREMLPHLNPPPHVTIFYEVKADLSEEDLQVLARAQVWSIQPGIESLATSTLKLMRKGVSAFQNVQLLKNCALYGIYPSWSILVGFPDEDEATYTKYIHDIPLLVHLPPPGEVCHVRYDRYSPYFNEADTYELKLQPYRFYELVYPFNKESLMNLAYYFMDTAHNERYAKTMEWISKIREKLDPWRRSWDSKQSQERPKLFFREKGARSAVIYDSRWDEPVEHHVNGMSYLVLEHLATAKRFGNLAAELSHIPGLDLEKELAFLRSRGLIFEEGDRFLSLVLPAKPSFHKNRQKKIAAKAMS